MAIQNPIIRQVPPVQQTEATPPVIKRDGSGVAIQSGLAGLQGNTDLIATAKELILRKQGMNKDINDQASYWRTVAGDTTSFGTQTPYRTKLYSNPKDINYRYLDPEQQTAIRNSRTNAANANLKTIAEERKYRGDTMDDTITALEKWETQKAKKETDSDVARARQLSIWAAERKAKNDAGVPLTAEDFHLDPSQGILEKTGGSDAWRHNNPTLLKYNETTKELGAMPGAKSPDGGIYAIFPDKFTGEDAFLNVITKDPKASLNKVLADVYGRRITAASLGVMNMPVADMDDNLKKSIIDKVSAKNKWTEGNIIGASTTSRKFYSDANIRTLAETTGMKPSELDKMTDDELSQLAVSNKDDLVKIAVDKIPAGKLLKSNIDKDFAKVVATSLADHLSAEETVAALKVMGVEDAQKKYDDVITMIDKSSMDLIAQLTALNNPKPD